MALIIAWAGGSSPRGRQRPHRGYVHAWCAAETLSAMRSVQVFPGMDLRRLTSMLDSLGERAGSEWFGVSDRRLEVSLTRYESAQDLIHGLEDEGSFSASEVDAPAAGEG
ncbi:hypothetical protein EV644_11932 [Kribbella orskensis]|uniref:Uncharacterized protein n=1 Tax=Kribbella orskensis TaxID=2512216 RepID=A0ABY2BBH9_9ACTN|nr:hypothetical protein EV644_11932 [Kribbella orskensis]